MMSGGKRKPAKADRGGIVGRCRWAVLMIGVSPPGPFTANATAPWRYVYRAIDQFGQIIDVFVSARRDADAACRFFERAINATKVTPAEVITDQAPVYPAVLEELLPAAWHRTDRYANNRVECDHGRLKARLRPMRGLKRDRSTRVIVAGHAFIQNVRRGHYELAVDHHTSRRVAAAFDELAAAI
jgi:transposase-like protein